MHLTNTANLKMIVIMIRLIKVQGDRCRFIIFDGIYMLIDASLKFSFRFTNVLFTTFFAGDDIDKITSITSDVTDDIVTFIISSACYCISFSYKLTLITFTAAFS